MIEFMDGIVEAVEEFAERMTEGVGEVIGISVKLVVILTAPIWILPYKGIRKALERQADYSYAKKAAKAGEKVIEGLLDGFESGRGDNGAGNSSRDDFRRAAGNSSGDDAGRKGADTENSKGDDSRI